MNRTYNCTVSVTSDCIVNTLMDIDQEELIEIIKDLDLQVGDWDFTESLYNFFKGQMEDRMDIKHAEELANDHE